ncbi:hypothetical protein Tcan_18114 [Toxocara canis]|uniref:Uncharacterized protein n=1 Tax=Toxocara canis TaxID=6265 RepID=A0A0B2UTE1_TOXCA|nr:hypothetical protein Tcan_18114 [Toxocara canis]
MRALKKESVILDSCLTVCPEDTFLKDADVVMIPAGNKRALHLCKKCCEVQDEDSRRISAAKDRLRKKLQKNNARRSAVDDIISRKAFNECALASTGSMGACTIEELLSYVTGQAQMSKGSSKKRTRKSRRRKKETNDKQTECIGDVSETSKEKMFAVGQKMAIPSSWISADFDEVFRPLIQEKIDKLSGWHRQFEQFKLTMWEAREKVNQKRIEVRKCDLNYLKNCMKQAGIEILDDL